MKGLQCEKALWLTKHEPDLKPLPSSFQQARFDEGHAVGNLAKTCFENGIDIAQKASTFTQRLSLTQTLLSAARSTLFEATVSYMGVLVMADILIPNGYSGGWTLIEVKSATSEKAVFLDDIAVQYWVLTRSGIRISKVELWVVNSNYERKGPIDPVVFFKRMDVTQSIRQRQKGLYEQVQHFRTVLKTKTRPEVAIGPQCFSPYDCDFMNVCWANLPENSVFELAGLHRDKKFEWFEKGITTVAEVPTQGLPLFQQIQINAENEDHGVRVNQPELQQFLAQLHYPLACIDFEGFQMALPPFDGLKPYQQVPFLVSMHIQHSPDEAPVHIEKMVSFGEDPRYLIAEVVAKNIPKNACVVAYSAAYEKSVLHQLAQLFPQFSEPLLQAAQSVIDLMTPFQKGFVYSKKMRGKLSIKSVVPAFVEGLSYADLVIADGEMAVLAYSQLATEANEAQKKELERQLRDYCTRDTYAMMQLIQALQKLGVQQP